MTCQCIFTSFVEGETYRSDFNLAIDGDGAVLDGMETKHS